MIYRNWPQICKVDFPPLRITLSTIDLTSSAGRRLTDIFTECFSTEPVRGPFPLSVLREQSRQLALEHGQRSVDHLSSYNVLAPNNIPYIDFDVNGNNVVGIGDLPLLPPHIPADSKFGDIVEHEGAKWIVVENNKGIEEICIALLECIDPAA